MFRNSELKSESCWISIGDNLPDVCCSCGMYTDHRVKVRHTESYETKASKTGTSVLMFLIHLFSGPLGWFIAMLTHDEDEQMTTVKEKVKIKISQCRLCSGQSQPEVVDSRRTERRYRFVVHPEFARQYAIVNSEDEQRENLSPWK